jgi:hypothetical protein
MSRMSFEPSHAPRYRIVASERRSLIDELDEVVLSRDVVDMDGQCVPAGSVGTVVGVWGEMAAFEVEFAQPFQALATVQRDRIS